MTIIEETDDYTITRTESDAGYSDTFAWKPGRQPVAEVEREERDFVLRQAIPTLRQWAQDAEATTATNTNAVATLNVVIDRLGVFFDHFADLLENQYDGR